MVHSGPSSQGRKPPSRGRANADAWQGSQAKRKRLFKCFFVGFLFLVCFFFFEDEHPEALSGAGYLLGYRGFDPLVVFVRFLNDLVGWRFRGHKWCLGLENSVVISWGRSLNPFWGCNKAEIAKRLFITPNTSLFIASG